MTTQTKLISNVEIASELPEKRRIFSASMTWNSHRAIVILSLGAMLFAWNTPWTSDAHTRDNPRLMLVGIYVYVILSILIAVATQTNPFDKRCHFSRCSD